MSDYFSYQNNQFCVEQVPLAEIAQRFGTPCYVYSHVALTEGYRQFKTAFAGREHLICYAVKANSNLAILHLLAWMGAGFDIVSGGELYRLLRIGVPVAAIEFEEDRGVGDGHLCFDDEYAEDLGGLIELLNDLLVGNVGDMSSLECGFEVATITFNARCVGFGNECEFLVRIDVGADVSG